jgi:hypothetical protein
MGPSISSIAQLNIQKEAFRREKTRNTLFSAMKRKRNKSKIMWIRRLLWQKAS